MALPQVFANESVALVDIGFKQTSICVLDRGELALIRVVSIGGDKLTAGLAEAMNITYADAEGVKVGMAGTVRTRGKPPRWKAGRRIDAQVTPLGRELRASLDFFEHQQDRPVSQVYVSGGDGAVGNDFADAAWGNDCRMQDMEPDGFPATGVAGAAGGGN